MIKTLACRLWRFKSNASTRSILHRSSLSGAKIQKLRLSSTTLDTSQLSAWQKGNWLTYLASGLGSDNLFRSIDTNNDKSISVNELHVFIESVDYKGVHPRAFKILDELTHEHELDIEGFKSWLILATKFGAEKNSAYQLEYDDYIQLGAREPSLGTGDDYYSLNKTTMSQAVRRMQYAVRGQIVMKADKLKAEGRDIVFTNIGNPQAVGQAPITFFRQVLALTDLGEYGINHPDVRSMFPADVVTRTKEALETLGSGTGAYTGSQGALGFRKDVAKFIEERDGHPAYPGNIFLSNGASSAIESVLTTIMSTELCGVMIPIPQYPLYSALIAKLTGTQVDYYLDEENNWAVSKESLEEQLKKANMDGVDVKALVIINPGNPTGVVMDKKGLEVICKFCSDNGIVLLADEVYQRNVYTPHKEFLSAKKVALETPGCENLQLVSFHSTSKGLIGECGRRGGYMELHNIDRYVQSQVFKLASCSLCSTVSGQVMTSLMVKPPKLGDESYDLFSKEEHEIFAGMKRRSKALVDGLNKVDGITCNEAEGAMYAFPKVELSNKAIACAEKQEMSPDVFYCLSLLNETGICVVPGSGFGQKEGRYGFRTTFLPPDEQMLPAIDLFADHHRNFTAKYSD